MRMADFICKKRDGGVLTDEEIQEFVQGVTTGEIPDYQISALLMAVYFRGMTARETAALTMAMAHSGEMVDLSPLPGIPVDKHSTGGVGDKTTLVVSPIVASLGVKVAKMSGRGLGHTGGTIDKMEAIPGLRTSLDQEEFFRIVRQVGMCVVGQSGNLNPADKRLYGLRDVTGTVESLPLIASSIMSKKIAAGAQRILLDVKTGSGALLKTREASLSLAKSMVEIGERVGRRTAALLTDMNQPLGRAIGNALEIKEVLAVLQNRGPADLTSLCIELAANMLELAGRGSLELCRSLAIKQLQNGQALAKFQEFVQAQGGDFAALEQPSYGLSHAALPLPAAQNGVVSHLDAQLFGLASVALGAGRAKKEDAVDPCAGILLHKKRGDAVCQGQPVATLFASSIEKCFAGLALLQQAVEISAQAPPPRPLILARADAQGVEQYE